jgi:hypothetical protein
MAPKGLIRLALALAAKRSAFSREGLKTGGWIGTQTRPAAAGYTASGVSVTHARSRPTEPTSCDGR